MLKFFLCVLFNLKFCNGDPSIWSELRYVSSAAINKTTSEVDSKIIELSCFDRNNHTITHSAGFQTFCHKEFERSIMHIFTTAYIEIRGHTYCEINIIDNKLATHISSNTSSNFLEKTKRYILYLFFTATNSEPCYRVVRIPLYRYFCFSIETNSSFSINLLYTYFDSKNLILFLFSVFLFITSGRICRHKIFYYFCGITICVAGSLLIIFLILVKNVSHKKFILFGLLTSGSFFFPLVKNFFRFLESSSYEQLTVFAAYYISITVFISWSFLHHRGPVIDKKILFKINLSLKIFSLFLFYLTMASIEETIFLILTSLVVTISISFLLILILLISKKVKLKNKSKRIQYQLNKTVCTDYTDQELKKLRLFCKSDDCNVWDLVKKLSKPKRFSEFIVNFSSGISEKERLAHVSYLINSQPDGIA
jgi:hypothetical protein